MSSISPISVPETCSNFWTGYDTLLANMGDGMGWTASLCNQWSKSSPIISAVSSIALRSETKQAASLISDQVSKICPKTIKQIWKDCCGENRWNKDPSICKSQEITCPPYWSNAFLKESVNNLSGERATLLILSSLREFFKLGFHRYPADDGSAMDPVTGYVLKCSVSGYVGKDGLNYLKDHFPETDITKERLGEMLSRVEFLVNNPYTPFVNVPDHGLEKYVVLGVLDIVHFLQDNQSIINSVAQYVEGGVHPFEASGKLNPLETCTIKRILDMSAKKDLVNK